VRNFFIGTVMITTAFLAIGWKCWLVIADRHTSQKKAALAGAVLAGLATATVAMTLSLPSN
jgi:hypothetical protein